MSVKGIVRFAKIRYSHGRIFMVGKYDMCYSCFRDLELAGIRPPERAADLIIDVSPLDNVSIQEVIQR